MSSDRRPRTRLFGTSSALSAPARYSAEPKRPSIRPFRIPGFERAQASITSSRASRLGFDLGLGGRALSDPIASMYDSAGGAGSRLDFINGIGDLGGFDSVGGGGGDFFVGARDPLLASGSLGMGSAGSGLGFSDGLITAANSRDLRMLDLNSAGSRLRQPIDIGSYGNQMVSSSTLGGRGNFDLNFGSSGLGGEGGGGGGGGQFLMSGNTGGQQGGLGLNQMSLGQQSGQSLGGVGGGQLGMGSNNLISLDMNDFGNGGSGGMGFASNLGQSSSASLGLGSNLDQFGTPGQMGNGFNSGQLGLGSSSSMMDSNQLTLNSLGSNQVGLGSGQMSTLGMSSSQQGFLGQGNEGNGMATVGNSGNSQGSQMGQSQMGVVGVNGGGQLSSQAGSGGFSNSLGLAGSTLTGGRGLSPGDVVII